MNPAGIFRKRNLITMTGLMMLLLVAVACGSDSTNAQSSDPTQPPAATATARATEQADPTSSTGDPGSGSSGTDLVFEVTDGSEATFTVNEQLSRLPAPNDAVLRTGAITGEVRLDGEEFTVEIDLHELTSDQERRDEYVRNQLFPNQPVTTIVFDGIANIPDGLLDGDEIATTATGTVNVNGADAEIEFEIESRLDDDTLFVLGRADFVWADFGMTAPVSQFFEVRDEVFVEVLLATQRL